jgi:hypothetical protein
MFAPDKQSLSHPPSGTQDPVQKQRTEAEPELAREARALAELLLDIFEYRQEQEGKSSCAALGVDP